MTVEEYIERVEQLKAKLFPVAMLYLNSSSMAMDAVDEAVYKGYRHIKQLKKPEFFDTWMTRILLNICYKEQKRGKRFSTPYHGAEDTTQIQYDNLELKTAIQLLPQKIKDVIILRYFSGYTLKEVAALLDIPQGTVVTHQRKGLALLKLELSEEDYNG